MGKMLIILVALACGCGGAPAAELPACDTLRTVWFVSRCDAEHARCALQTTAPAGAVPTGCTLTIIAVPGGPELVTCVESCEEAGL